MVKRNAILVISLLLLTLLTPTPPTHSQEFTYGRICVRAPTAITQGETATVDVEIEIAEDTASANFAPEDGRQCAIMDEVYEIMGVGLGGISFGNFSSEPENTRIRGRLQPGVANEWTWILSADGEAGRGYNLMVYAFVDDETRDNGYRPTTRIRLRVEIAAPPGTFLEQVLAFLNSTKEIIALVSLIVVGGIALREQIKNLFKRGKKTDTDAQPRPPDT